MTSDLVDRQGFAWTAEIALLLPGPRRISRLTEKLSHPQGVGLLHAMLEVLLSS